MKPSHCCIRTDLVRFREIVRSSDHARVCLVGDRIPSIGVSLSIDVKWKHKIEWPGSAIVGSRNVEKWSPSNSRGSTEAANRRIGPRTSRLKDHRGSVDGRKSEDSGGGNMLFVTRILACARSESPSWSKTTLSVCLR